MKREGKGPIVLSLSLFGLCPNGPKEEWYAWKVDYAQGVLGKPGSGVAVVVAQANVLVVFSLSAGIVMRENALSTEAALWCVSMSMTIVGSFGECVLSSLLSIINTIVARHIVR